MSATPAPAAPAQAAIAIVHWQAPEPLLACLDTLPARSVTILDNGSDETRHRALAAGIEKRKRPGVSLQRSETNLGFGAGCNRLWRDFVPVTSPLILFLNPDTLVPAGAIEMLEQALANDPELVAVTPIIERLDSGAIDFAGGDIDWWRGEARHRTTSAPAGEVGASAFLTGAALMVRRRALAEVGGFREDLFLYWEDVDLTLRLRAHGRLGVVTAAHVRHAVSPLLAASGDRFYYSVRNALFTVRRFRPWLQPLVRWRYRRVLADLERRGERAPAEAVAQALTDFARGRSGPR